MTRTKDRLPAVFLCAALALALAGAPGPAEAQLSNPFFREADYRDYWQQGDYADALRMLQDEIDARPELAKTRAYRYMTWLSDRAELRFLTGQTGAAISDLETITEYLPEPGFVYRLSQLYRYRGQMERYREALEKTVQNSQRRWYFLERQENMLALAKAAEQRGENPKMLLSSIYTSLMENFPDYADGFSGAGELALRKHDYALAEKYFLQALVKEPENQNALAGLCETYWKSSDPRLEDTLERLFEINPNHFRALAVQTEIFLDNFDFEQALSTIEVGLSINPNHLELMSLKAAALFMEDRLDDMRAIQEEALRLNPVCSEAYRIPARVASRHYRFKEAAEMLGKALEINPDDTEARAQYALDLLRLGRHEEGREQLELAFAGDPFHVQVYNLLNLMDTIDSFETVVAPPFHIQLPKMETPALADDVRDLLERARHLYTEKYKVGLEEPVHIQIFDDHDDFMVRSVGLPGSVGFMGICFGRLITMDSPSARTQWSMNWRSVLWHEFVHVITLQKTNNRMPRWLSEGISVYEELEFSPACGHKMDVAYKPLIDFDDLPGLEDLETYFTRPKTPYDIQLGYFFSGEFVRFYAEEYGFDPLPAALDKIGGGMETNAALAEACGETIQELNTRFQSFLSERLKPYGNLPEIPEKTESPLAGLFDAPEGEGGGPHAAAPEPDWFEASSPFTDALKKGAEAMENEDWETAEGELLKAHELFPDYTGGDAPLNLLARVYDQSGQRDKLIETLWRVLDWDATQFPAAKRLMGLLREDGDWEGVSRAAHWAMGIDPFDLDVRKALLAAYRETGRPERALGVAGQLVQLDRPASVDHRMTRISILKETARWDNARRETLRLLEDVPHYWDAQRALLEIAAARSGGTEGEKPEE